MGPTFEASRFSTIMMATQRNSKRKKLRAKTSNETTFSAENARIETKGARTRTKEKQKAIPKSKESLTKAQKAVQADPLEVKRKRQTRIRAEVALVKTKENPAVTRLEAHQEHQARIKRVSFVVRLTVDEHGQPRRTEIEQVESSRKQNFLTLDGERLVAFMKACISPTIIPEPAIPPAPPPEKVEVPTPIPLRPKSSLIVSDVRVFRPEHPDFVALTLAPEESFVVQARFQLQGPAVQFLTTQAFSFEMKVYANEVTSGASMLLTTYSAKLIQDVLEYTASAEVPGLPLGLFRLFTVVILSAPVKMAGFYGKTIINVT